MTSESRPLYLVEFQVEGDGRLYVDLSGRFWLAANAGTVSVRSSTGGQVSTTSTSPAPIPVSILLDPGEDRWTNTAVSASTKADVRQRIASWKDQHLTLENVQKVATLAKTINDLLGRS